MELPCAVVPDPVDEQCRGPGHAIDSPLLEVLFDVGASLVALHVGGESTHVEPKGSREVEQTELVDRRLALVDAVVQLPESSLLGGGLARTGRELRTGVGALVGELAKHVDEPIPERLA